LINLKIFLFHDFLAQSWNLINLKIRFQVFSNVFTKNLKKFFNNFIIIIIITLLIHCYYCYIFNTFLLLFHYHFIIISLLIHYSLSLKFSHFFYCKCNALHYFIINTLFTFTQVFTFFLLQVQCIASAIFFAVAVTITTIFQFATTAILLLDRDNLFSFCFDFGVLFTFVEQYRRLSQGYFI
jgi:hypothetical protein